MLTEGKDFQVMESCEADFEKLTWSFTMRSNQHVAAGNYAIMPVETYAYLARKHANAESLLRTWLSGKLDDCFKERVERHFDPKPL